MDNPPQNDVQRQQETAENSNQNPATPASAGNNTQRNAGTNANRQQRHRNRRGVNRNNLRSREGFFMHYLFVTLSVRYASYFKPTVRRLIEFFTLIKAIMMLLLLIYVHVTFVKESGNCLEHIEDIWPRSGVLKVQVEANTTLPSYQYFFARANPESWATSFESDPYQAVFKYTVQIGKNGLPKILRNQPTTPNDYLKRARKLFGLKDQAKCPIFNMTHYMKQEAKKMLQRKFSESTPEIHFLHPENEQDIPQWILIDPSVSDTVAELKMLKMQELSGFNVGPQPVRDYYSIEYSAEFGYLRLSTITRHKLGIPVMVVTLDPVRDACFGEGTKRWMLDTFFGYDDLVMSSIKRLAEKDNKQGGGYLRNLVTGEHYKFITLWVSHASYVLAFAVMLVFTLVVTMLLRYSYHQIFVFMVELLHILDTDATPVFPAAPMLTIILALVGTEEIMTEFFHDSTLAFYVILSIWIADQFDAICMHTFISRRHWVRFFFLYHFAFYAYHYRFNGQFSELALFTTWLFIQHSMFYFLHHYEIPAIQRQIRLRQILFQNNSQNAPPAPPTAESGDTPPPPPENENQQQPPNDNNGSQDPANGGNDANSGATQEEPQSPPSSSQPTEGTSVSLSLCERDPIDSGKCHLDLDLEPSLLHMTVDIDIFIHDDVIKEPDTVALWEELTPILTEEEMAEPDVAQAVGFSKYCSLIMMLFFAVVALILVFSLAVLLLNQGRLLGARFAANNFDKVANIVR